SYACAGLPAPDDLPKYAELRPDEYLKIIGSRWANPILIREEISRFLLFQSSKEAGENLNKIDWDNEFDSLGLQTDSIVAKVALSGYGTRERITGWTSLNELQFSQTFESKPGRLVVFHSERELIRPSRLSNSLLVLEPAEDNSGVGNDLLIDQFSLLIP